MVRVMLFSSTRSLLTLSFSERLNSRYMKVCIVGVYAPMTMRKKTSKNRELHTSSNGWYSKALCHFADGRLHCKGCAE